MRFSLFSDAFGQRYQEQVVTGRLKEHYEYWENELNASRFVLNVIKHGYSLPLKSELPSFYAKNNASSLKHKGFVEKAIYDLIENNCVQEVDTPPFCVNPLAVAEKGKLRLVLDLRHVSDYLHVEKFRYEDLRTFSDMAEKNLNFEMVSSSI